MLSAWKSHCLVFGGGGGDDDLSVWFFGFIFSLRGVEKIHI